MKIRFKTDILVRNNRIQQMENLGLNVNYRILTNEEYLLELKSYNSTKKERKTKQNW